MAAKNLTHHNTSEPEQASSFWWRALWPAGALAALALLFILKSPQLGATFTLAALFWLPRRRLFQPHHWLTCLVALLCFLPESGREWYPSFLSIGDSLLIILMAMWLRRGGLAQLHPQNLNRLHTLVLVFLAAGALSMGTGYSFNADVDAVFTDFLQRCGYAALLIILAPLFSTRRARISFIRCLIISASVVALYGILQASVGFAVIALFEYPLEIAGYYNYTLGFVQKYIWWSEEMVRKPYSPFFGPNSLAGLLLLALACAWAQIATGRYFLRREVLWLCFALLYICLIFTFSRTCLVAFTGMILLSILLAGWRRRATLTTALCLILATITLPGTVLHLDQRIQEDSMIADRSTPEPVQQFKSLKQENVQSRVDEIRQALRHISHYPFFGTGFSTRLSPAGQAVPARHDITVSNLYLELATKTGLLGLGIFTALMCTLMLPALFRLYRLPECDTVELALVLGISAALISGLFDHTFLTTPALACLFWMSAAALSALSRSMGAAKG